MAEERTLVKWWVFSAFERHLMLSHHILGFQTCRDMKGAATELKPLQKRANLRTPRSSLMERG